MSLVISIYEVVITRYDPNGVIYINIDEAEFIAQSVNFGLIYLSSNIV